MRILVLSPYLPHPLAGHGGSEYIFGLVKYLSKSHTVTLLTFVDHEERLLADDLRKLPITTFLIPRWKGRQPSLLGTGLLAVLRGYQLLRSILFWQPYYVSKYFHPAMARKVDEETRQHAYDVVQVEFAQMGQYVRYVRSGRTVLRAHDVVFRPAYRSFMRAGSLAKKLIYYVEWCRWARYEPRMVRHYDSVLTFTEQDRMLLQKLASHPSVVFNARGIEVPAGIVPYESREPGTLLFVGVYNHRPNADAALWLCTEIFPLVLRECPNARLYLVGRNAPPALVDAARKFPSITLPGFVENLDEYWNKASVFVAPVRFGGGIKTKIIHAQSFGLPVVATPLGAEGIESADSSTLLTGRSADEIARKVVYLIKNPAAAAQLARNGREAVLQHYAWNTVIRQQEELYRSLCGEHTEEFTH